MIQYETLTDEEIEQKLNKCYQMIGPYIDRGYTSIVDSIRSTIEQLEFEKEIRKQKKLHEIKVKDLEKKGKSLNDPINIGGEIPSDTHDEDE